MTEQSPTHYSAFVTVVPEGIKQTAMYYQLEVP